MNAAAPQNENGCGCAAQNENGCGCAAQNKNENGCGCAAQNKNENGCGCAAQNKNENEVEVENEVPPGWTSSKRKLKLKLQTENCKLQTVN